ncbi:MAG: ABC transporter ATP-binding protein [Alphaproteobacteria bacterium]|nr:ABC transporter ATP-binding protein [Alphaproteobacteria bacterium]
MSDDLVIEAKGLTRRYGRGPTLAVDHIDLAIKKGEIFGLLGPNGAGKTTTILMVLGLTESTEGTVSVLGHDPLREPLQVKRRVGYLPDSVGFYDNLSARENLIFTARLAGIDKAEAGKRIEESMARVRLTDVLDNRVATYSRGMRQRLGLAEILMKRAEIAILDEPTSGLDPHATFEFLEMIRGLKADGVAVLVSSHALEQVQSVCDRVALFNKGKIALQGTVEELGEQVLGLRHDLLVEADGQDIAARLGKIEGVSAVEPPGSGRGLLVRADRDVTAEVVAAATRDGGRLRQIRAIEPSLQAIYNRYFEGVKDAA